MELEDVKRKINKSLETLYEKDKELFGFTTIDPLVSERCLTFRLEYYLQNEFIDFDVDSEYNRHLQNIKVIEDFNIFPDLIIHKRLKDTHNLLWIEIKKKQENCKDDIDRLKKVTSNGYMYKYGVMIILEKEKPKVFYYKSGNEVGSD